MTALVLLLSWFIFATIIARNAGEHDFDGLNGADHEFKVEIAAGTEQCFFQKIKHGARFHVSFEVLRGGDRSIDFYIKDPNYRVIYSVNMKTQAAMEDDIDNEGIYSICADNRRNSFSNKLLYVRISVFHKLTWNSYMEEMAQFVDVGNRISTSLGEVDQTMTIVKNFQSRRRMTMARDSYIIVNNNSYIGYYSLAQCFIIILTTCSQVYILRRFFRNVKMTPSAKPRV